MSSRLLNLVALCAAVFTLAYAKEPACSAFHYEEKLLEKMIRMEMRVEELYKEIKQKTHSVEGAVSKMENKQAALDGKHADVIANLSEMQRKLDETERKLKSLEQQKPERSNSPAVAFNVNTLKSPSLKKGSKFIFTIELLNQGGGYSTSTGEFTAPVDGLYLFSLFVCTNKPNSPVFTIKQRAQILLKGTAYENDGYTCTSGSVVASVSAGQKVWPEAMNSGAYYRQSSHAMNTFTGALLHQY